MYAKHGNLVDADTSGAKASTKHLESCLEVIQGHTVTHFGLTEKPTRDCVLMHNNARFRVEISKERSEHLHFRCLFLGTPCECSHNPYISRN